jgi:hypothetical protein
MRGLLARTSALANRIAARHAERKKNATLWCINFDMPRAAPLPEAVRVECVLLLTGCDRFVAVALMRTDRAGDLQIKAEPT